MACAMGQKLRTLSLPLDLVVVFFFVCCVYVEVRELGVGIFSSGIFLEGEDSVTQLVIYLLAQVAFLSLIASLTFNKRFVTRVEFYT